MLMIVCSDAEMRPVIYGPFCSMEATQRYAHKHKLGYPNQNYLVFQLNDSGEAMDA